MAVQEDQPPPARFGTDRAETQRAYEQAHWRDERPCAELQAHYRAVLAAWDAERAAVKRAA